MKDRVVITGLGIVSPLGVGVDHNWNRIKSKKSGISKLGDEYDKIPSQIAGLVPRGTNAGEFNIDDFMSKSEQRRNGKFISYAVAAAAEANKMAKLGDIEDRTRIGVCVASGIGGLPEICETCNAFEKQKEEFGSRKISPFFIPSVLTNLAPGYVAIKFECKGPNYGASSACASASNAIADAAMLIKSGHADIMIAGGAEASICPLGVAGFAALRALSTNYNNNPEVASRPFDNDHDGFVIAEGAGILVLESLESAISRNAIIYGELASYGMTCDASHITTPSGEQSARAMSFAIKEAGLNPSDIGYVNAHATSTPVGDKCEIDAIKSVFGEHVYSDKFAVSSTKSYTGHLLGAAGGVEAIYTLMALRNQTLPPTINVNNPIPEIANINFVPEFQSHTFDYAISNSFGFGGTNTSLLFKKYD
ncbi:beta-ketoacyl-ACP synthase II [Candidatus Cytomitobacter primus]|uniref:3-oxoacyl-[acyl-carrier-protein] synthase 2 n=1 Tax=Candidatus Cytomitobacter primus TaxID=2066024 RepID=A0A5C0UGK9_9PROT|nr:beta-ketoacyl-ACP synthase II [Candidatus Cytomitobacter primus]QEK38693.1 beta-ketoacyl-ACP synthase II [Candidatus Cytomitobacter primus]